MLKSLKTLALVAPIVAGLSWSAAHATELTVGPSVPPGNDTYVPYRVMEKLLPEMTGNEVTLREIGMEVVNLKNAVDSLQNGITDIAHVLTLYSPADFPNSVFISELASLGHDGDVMQAAVTEYLVNCPKCMDEFNKLGLVYTGHVSTRPYNVLSTKPVRKLEDLKGLRLRSGGSPFSRWATAMGAVPVQMSSNDQYEAIQNGLLDGTLNPPSALISGRLDEVVHYVTDMPVGTFHAAMPFTMAKRAWAKLTPDQRKIFLRAGAVALSSYIPKAKQSAKKGIEDAAANGLEVLKPDQDLIDANKAFADSEVATVAKIGSERYGIDNPEEKIAYFKSLIAKWTKIFDERGYDADTVGNAIYDEVWSKVDTTTYGM